MSSACLAAGAAGPLRAETLSDAISLAYQNNPTLQSQRAQLRAVDETYVQARAGYRPQASVTLATDYANNASTLDAGLPDAAASLSVSQPLYTGGLVSAQVRAASASIMAARQKLRQAEADVIQAVIQSYADVRRDQQALSIADENVGVLIHQLDETQARLEAGDVTQTDVAQAQARLAAARAQRALAQAQLSVSRANYVAVVGQSPGDLAPEPALVGMPGAVEQAFDVANAASPSILGATYAEQASAAQVSEARSAFLPTVSVRAQLGYSGYYANDQLLGVRNGVYDHNISASVVMTQPLFAGGTNASRVRQALEMDNSQLIAIEIARRQVVQAISQAWAQLLAARANVTSEAEQVRADQVAYEGTHEEQAAGLRTTLDVLNADQELRTAQLALVGARHDEYVASVAVLNAMGRLSAGSFRPDQPAYSPEAAFDKVRRAGAVPWEGLVAGLDSIGAPAGPTQPAPAASGGKPNPSSARPRAIQPPTLRGPQ
jgi:outer membrane protein